MSCLQETTSGPDDGLTGARRAGEHPEPGAVTQSVIGRITDVYEFYQNMDDGDIPVKDRVDKDKIKERIVEFLKFSFEHHSKHEIDTVFAAGHSHQILELMTRLTKTSDELLVKKLGNGNGAKITITKRGDGSQIEHFEIKNIDYIFPHSK